jgi:hypothetical protein
MAGLLDYRGHEAADVPPVLIERGDGRVRIIVQYPPAARRRARNRCLIAAGLTVALLLTVPVARGGGNLFIQSLGSFWFIAVIATIVMAMLWVQAYWTYVIETDGRQLCIEHRGLRSTRRRCCKREHVREIELASNLQGRAVALWIRSKDRDMQGRYFEYLDERFLREIADALREGLGLERPPSEGS